MFLAMNKLTDKLFFQDNNDIKSFMFDIFMSVDIM